MRSIKMLTLLLALLTVGVLNAQTKDLLIVRGKVNPGPNEQVGLYRSVDGAWECVTTTNVDTLGNYYFALNAPKTELLAIGRPVNTGTKEKAVFAGHNGEVVDIATPEGFVHYSFKGTVSNNNKVLEDWGKKVQEVLPDHDPYNTFKVLFPKIDGFLKSSKEYAARVKSNDAAFDQFLKLYIETQAQFGVLNHYFQPSTIFPSKEEMHPFYAGINERMKFDSPLYAKMPISNIFIALLNANLGLQQKGAKLNMDGMDKGVKANYFVWNTKMGYANYEAFSEDYDKYYPLLTEKRHKARVLAYMEKNGFTAAGKPAIDFTYPGLDGKNISLSDFKGKVVVVDVWATWCQPCLKEVPHMKKLEEEFHGRQDIAFLAVSVDKESEKAKWEKMIETDKLPGIHLFANGFSEIAKSYEIVSIPRFMVFDKKGNIVSTNSPRPSDPKLKEMILKELNK